MRSITPSLYLSLQCRHHFEIFLSLHPAIVGNTAEANRLTTAVEPTHHPSIPALFQVVDCQYGGDESGAVPTVGALDAVGESLLRPLGWLLGATVFDPH